MIDSRWLRQGKSNLVRDGFREHMVNEGFETLFVDLEDITHLWVRDFDGLVWENSLNNEWAIPLRPEFSEEKLQSRIEKPDLLVWLKALT
jgi:hypothetical protein